MIADFFYNHQAFKNILLAIVHEDLIPNRLEKGDDIVALYRDEVLVGINFLNISKTIKIHSSGKIFLPNRAFIEAINALLVKQNITFDVPLNSGFLIVDIIKPIYYKDDKMFVEVQLKERKIIVIAKKQNSLNSKGIIALNGTLLENGTRVKEQVFDGIKSEGILLNFNDDEILNEEIKNLPNGSDFYSLI